MSNALTPEQQRAMVAAYTITLPEPAFGFLVVSEETGQWIESRAGEAAFDADNLHAHAAAVSAAKAAEIAQLREYLDAAQRRGEELRAEVAALTENGPPMQRGTTIEGTPWMGTMREVLEDYKSAADTEARWGDEARAEVAGLRKDAERYRWLRDGDEVSDYPYPVMRQGGKYDFDRTIWFEELDAAIDAAMAARKGKA